MIPKMRSIGEVVQYFKLHDPDTQISDHAIRTLLKQGFPHIKVGAKNLVDLDLLIQYFNDNYKF